MADTPQNSSVPTETRALADYAVKIACEQLRTSVNFKRPRMDEVQRNVDEYFNKVKKPLRGRVNIPVPVMGGFVDTILSKTDEPTSIKFGYGDIADYRSSLKLTSLYQFEAQPNRGNFDRASRAARKFGVFSGVGIRKIYYSRPWKFHIEAVHYADFHCEPMGGQDLEKHLFRGQTNIIRTIAHLKKAAKTGFYDAAQIALLEERYTDETYKAKMQTDIYDGSLDSFRAIGMDVDSNRYIGQASVNLTEWDMDVNGERYLLTFDYRSTTWIRFQKLADVFPLEDGEYPLSPWDWYHTHEDDKLAWSKSPADDMRPVSIGIRMFANQEFENRMRRNAGQRMFDPRVIKDATQLSWQPEGLVVGDSTIRPISQGIVSFETPELTGTINLINWLDQYTGQKTGITKDAQGQASTDKVGINYNNIQQAADRLGLMNKSYSASDARIAIRFMRAARDALDKGVAVKILGEKGWEWENINSADLHPVRDFDVQVSASNSEVQMDLVKRRERKDTLLALLANPKTAGSLNPDASTEEILRAGSFGDEDVKMLLDTSNYQDRIQVSKAAEENQDICAGKKVRPYRGATAGHLQHHLDFALDTDITDKQFKAIMAHIDAETPFAMRNALRQARIRAQLKEAANPQPTQPPPTAPVTPPLTPPTQPPVAPAPYAVA